MWKPCKLWFENTESKYDVLLTRTQRKLPERDIHVRLAEKWKMSGHYVQLCPNPLRFEPVTKENSVFFDEANRQVC